MNREVSMNYRKALKSLKKELNTIYLMKSTELDQLEAEIDASDVYEDEALGQEYELQEDTEVLASMIYQINDLLEDLEHFEL